MSLFIVDIKNLYRQTFGSKPHVPDAEDRAEEQGFVINGSADNVSQISGSALKTEYLGKEIWLPIKFVNLDASVFGVTELLLPYSVIRISGKKTIVKTPLAERKGTVKELYSIDDYSINIKGFVIDEGRVWPEKELIILKKLYELNEAIELDNALTNIFLDEDQRVTIEGLELPEVEGGRKHIRPFSFSIESDSVFTLELE
jgi:hypothetical protein